VSIVHLLLLHNTLADHLVHLRFNEGRADRLAVSVALAKVRDELLIAADVVSNSPCIIKGEKSF